MSRLSRAWHLEVFFKHGQRAIDQGGVVAVFHDVLELGGGQTIQPLPFIVFLLVCVVVSQKNHRLSLLSLSRVWMMTLFA